MDSGIDGSLDEISKRILDELQKDARTPYAELGRRVGLSPSATAERVRRLEEEGIIRAYRADINPVAIGLGIMVYIRMTCEGEKYKQFLAFVQTVEAVRECNHITGNDALIMKVLLNSIDELEQLIIKFLPYGTPTTSFVLSRPLVRSLYQLQPQKMATRPPWQVKPHIGGMQRSGL